MSLNNCSSESSMRLTLPSLSLALASAALLGFGVPLLVVPDLVRLIELGPATATGRSDVRAVYGGLEVGLGIFCGLCARRPPWFRAGLTMLALALAGVLAGRLVSLVADGWPRMITLVFTGGELAVAALAVAALRALPRDPAGDGRPRG